MTMPSDFPFRSWSTAFSLAFGPLHFEPIVPDPITPNPMTSQAKGGPVQRVGDRRDGANVRRV